MKQETATAKRYVPYGINGDFFVYDNESNWIPPGYGHKRGTKAAIQKLCDQMNKEQQPQDTSTRKDELKVNYYVDGGDYQRNKDAAEVYVRKEINGEQFDVCNMACNEEPGDAYENALNIKSALANTYGKGYNPAAMEELYKALDGIIKTLNHLIDNPIHAGLIDFAQTALKNAKTIKP